jgi:hypothetical protein
MLVPVLDHLDLDSWLERALTFPCPRNPASSNALTVVPMPGIVVVSSALIPTKSGRCSRTAIGKELYICA